MASELDDLRLRCLGLMLRPIIRFCLRGSHKLQDFFDVAKPIFVQVAAEEIRRSGKTVNISRLSVASGVHRKDVTTIYLQKDTPVRRTSALISRVIGRWEQSPEFTTQNRRPRALTYHGEGSDFYRLVTMVTQNVGPRSILAELERLGVIERFKDHIKLVKTVPRFHRDPEEGFSLLAEEVASLLEAVEENILEDREIRNLHIRTESNKVRQRDVPTIRGWLLAEGKSFHKRCRDFLALYDRDLTADEDTAREPLSSVSVSAFSFTQNIERAAPRSGSRAPKTQKLKKYPGRDALK